MGKKKGKNKVPGMKKGKAMKKAQKAQKAENYSKSTKNNDSESDESLEDTTATNGSVFEAESRNFSGSEELQGSVNQSFDYEEESGEIIQSEACDESAEASDVKCCHDSHTLPRPRFPRLYVGEFDSMLPSETDFPYHRPLDYHYCSEFSMQTYMFNACCFVDGEQCVMFTVVLSDEVMALSCLPEEKPNILCPRDKFKYVKNAPGQMRLGKLYGLAEPQTYYGLVYDNFLTLGRYLELSADFIPEDFPGIIKGILNGIFTVYSHFGFADVCDSSIVVHNATGKLLCPWSTSFPTKTVTLAGELKKFGGCVRRLSPKEKPYELNQFIHALEHVSSALQFEMLPFHPFLFSPYEKVNTFIPWLHKFAKNNNAIRLQLMKNTNEFPPWRQKVRQLGDSYREIKACLDF